MKPIFVCSYCLKDFHDRRSATLHVKTHLPWYFGKYICCQCEFSTDRKHRLHNHCALPKHVRNIEESKSKFTKTKLFALKKQYLGQVSLTNDSICRDLPYKESDIIVGLSNSIKNRNTDIVLKDSDNSLSVNGRSCVSCISDDHAGVSIACETVDNNTSIIDLTCGTDNTNTSLICCDTDNNNTDISLTCETDNNNTSLICCETDNNNTDISITCETDSNTSRSTTCEADYSSTRSHSDHTITVSVRSNMNNITVNQDLGYDSLKFVDERNKGPLTYEPLTPENKVNTCSPEDTSHLPTDSLGLEFLDPQTMTTTSHMTMSTAAETFAITSVPPVSVNTGTVKLQPVAQGAKRKVPASFMSLYEQPPKTPKHCGSNNAETIKKSASNPCKGDFDIESFRSILDAAVEKAVDNISMKVVKVAEDQTKDIKKTIQDSKVSIKTSFIDTCQKLQGNIAMVYEKLDDNSTRVGSLDPAIIRTLHASATALAELCLQQNL